ncbi:NAD(P)/FAD-dependent oxidoreductase [Shinella sp.]|uniref:NAD(P)/FAD-dependent oxidoreductase n=1 Tax=Shinella sp. TaxID=1870904 RepID=UPI0029B5BFAD|nr:FAD-dependent oxidoreductase [Shinella sp.]MDX3973517.1 FAD-dependent oxidoreductase [Shinella sp.]
MSHVVVIGTGQAAVALAARLRAENFDGRITLVGEERFAPYERPHLSKGVLIGEVPIDRILLRDLDWYGQHDITLLTGTAAVSVDPAAQTVSLQDGQRVPYDHLVFCTGATPRRLPREVGGELGGVHTLRGIADTQRLGSAFVPGRHLLVLGGGYIGLEAAASAVGRGLSVTVVEMAPRILQRVACEETSSFFKTLHQSHGVRILEGTGINRLIGDTVVEGVELADGDTLAVDLALIGIGVAPETSLARTAGVTISDGIDTDAQGRTNIENIWAAGDCANHVYQDQRLRVESVGNAIDRAETVARNIMGHGHEEIGLPWFWSDQFDCKLQIAGLNQGYDAVHVKQFSGSPQSRVHWYFRDGRLVACDAMNATRDYMVAKRLIEAGTSVEPLVLCQTDADLRSLLRR